MFSFSSKTKTKKRVFISFAHEDRAQVDGLRLLNANDAFDIEFYDESVRTAVDSESKAYIRKVIREKINRSSVTVCMIGKRTHDSEWVDWELEESDSKGNTIIAMALKGIGEAALPKLIKEKGLTFHGWDHKKLGELIDAA